MRIALYSHFFPPQIGGSGAQAKLLAEGFARLGHTVTVITPAFSSSAEEATDPFQLVRRPLLRQLCRVFSRSDVVLAIGPCLTAGSLARAMFKPLVVAHPMLPAQGMRGAATRLLCAGVPNIAPSVALARALPTPATVISNPYDDGLFQKRIPTRDRSQDVVFVGRLIKEKGLKNVLLALDLLRQRGREIHLTVVGPGPEAEVCRELSSNLGLSGQVTFVGAASPAQIAEICNAHRIAVVPSVWEEPFGIVALEAIACGCAVVGSTAGGLPEAIGPCGLTYPKTSVGDLAARLEQLMTEPRLLEMLQNYAKGHLVKHTRHAIASRYLSFIADCFPALAPAALRSRDGGSEDGVVAGRFAHRGEAAPVVLEDARCIGSIDLELKRNCYQHTGICEK
jgi:glycosyltransferase involved in cell wall biosynthesis